MEELSGKDLKKLEVYQNNQPLYEAIIAALQAAISEQVYDSPKAFMPVLTKVLANATADKKLLDKIADGLSVMDKDAEIQKDKKGNILFDKETQRYRTGEMGRKHRRLYGEKYCRMSRMLRHSLKRIWAKRNQS